MQETPFEVPPTEIAKQLMFVQKDLEMPDDEVGAQVGHAVSAA